MPQPRVHIALTAAFLLGAAHHAHAIRVRHDVPISAYNELARQSHLSAVGFVGAGNMGCSGTLIAPNLVLTAAHCVVKDDGSQVRTRDVYFRIDLPNGRSHRFRAERVDVHPDYNPNGGGIDVALVPLTEDVSVVEPLPVTTASPTGCIATLTGYGSQGTGNDPTSTTRLRGADRRFAAQNVVDRLRNDCCVAGNTMLHMDFDQPSNARRSSFGSAEPLPLEGGASFGDSGSPLIVDFNGRPYVVGVASYIYGIGRPGPGGYGEVTGYQWTGSGPVEFWLTMLGVDLVHDPDLVPDPEEVEGDEGSAPGDVDSNGVTDGRDAALLLQRLRAGDARADLNEDGQTDARDAAALLSALGIDRSVYTKRRLFNRAVRAYFRAEVEPFMTGATRRDLRRAERLLRQAWRHFPR